MVDFASAPDSVVWECTRSCALACAHCRSDADLSRHPDELTTAEGKRLIDQVAEMGTPAMTLSGGDPLNRSDLEELVRHGRSIGLRMGVVPAASLNLTPERFLSLKAAGADHVSLSLDGATASSHDGFRRVPGAFNRIVRASSWARDIGLPVRIQSCVGGWNRHEAGALSALVARLGAAAWEIYFLIPVGRGTKLEGLTPAQFEEVFAALEPAALAPFRLELIEGQHFERARPGRTRALNAGDGMLFVDHRGQLCPSALMPVSRGDIRFDGLAATYRHDSLFTGLRDHARLTGKCGRCEYRETCGGSRARAWAASGDAWAEDPACAHVPAPR
jgi:radical SAM protein with 4Fe4S-binding SPASM domain